MLMRVFRRLMLVGNDIPEDQIIYYWSNEKASVNNLDMLSHTFVNGKGKIICKNTITKIPNLAFSNNAITSFKLPSTVTSIESSAFANCNITDINITDNITSVGSQAFSGCSKVEFIKISGKDKSMGAGCFMNTGEALTINSNITGPRIFYSSSIGSASIMKTKSIGKEWFKDSKQLLYVYLKDESVETIEDMAFYDCSSLKSINIPESVSKLGKYVFRGCSSLYVDNGAIQYADTAAVRFSNNSLESYNFNNYKFILEECYNALNCTTFHIPDTIISINERALTQCYKVQNFTGKFSTEDGRAIIAGENLDTLIAYALNSGTEYQLDDSVKRIGEYAFAGATLNNFTIGKNVTQVGQGAFRNVKFNVLTITSNSSPISFDFNSFYQASADEVIFEDVTFPDQGSGWMNGGFANNNFKKLKIENTGSTPYRIGDYYFSGWKSLKSLEVKSDISKFGDYVFYQCSSLKEVLFDMQNTPSFDDYVFRQCNSLEKIEFRGLQFSIMYSTIPSITYYTLTGLPATCKIVVPDSLYDKWIVAQYWSTYANQIVKASEYEASLTE